MKYFVIVREEGPQQFTAQAAGIPELSVTATSRRQAVEGVKWKLHEWIRDGQLTAVEVPEPNPALQLFGHADPNDPMEQAYLAELARMKQEDLEQTLRGYDQECSGSSSIPTT